MLLANKKLKHLNISDNNIADDRVRHVTDGLQQNDTLTELVLEDCNISEKGNICDL